MRATLTVLTVAALLGQAGHLSAKKSDGASLRMAAGDSWTLEDFVQMRIPDPQTGKPLTPATRGVFRYRVEKTFEDGSAVASVQVVSLQGGLSQNTLKNLPVDYPPRPAQYVLLTPDGLVYGPYGEAARRKREAGAKDAESWLSGAPSPWVRYKTITPALEIGRPETMRLDGEKWRVVRLSDEHLSGAKCDVYSAELEKGELRVAEVTWFDRSAGTVRKRVVSERQAKNVSSQLTQVRR